MTERERWIVYPLLFLALGAALRDKLVDRTTTKSIVCQELSIVDEGSTGPQSQRTLARIGRAKPIAGGKSVAYFQINGDVELVDDDLSDHSPPGVLVKLGAPSTPDRPSTGYVLVRGEVGVDGIVNARQYIYQGIPMVPLQMAPGVPVPNVLPAIPRGGPKVPSSNPPKTKEPNPPPDDESKKGRDAAQPPSPADDSATPAK